MGFFKSKMGMNNPLTTTTAPLTTTTAPLTTTVAPLTTTTAPLTTTTAPLTTTMEPMDPPRSYSPSRNPIVIKMNGPMMLFLDLQRLYLRDANGNEIAYDVVANTDLRTFHVPPENMLIVGWPFNSLHYDGPAADDYRHRATWTNIESTIYSNPVPSVGDLLLTLWPVSPVSSMQIKVDNPDRSVDFRIEYLRKTYYTPREQSITTFD